MQLTKVWSVTAFLAMVAGVAQAQLNAFDIYFLIDQSGSIADRDPICLAARNLTCMELLADFANKTAFRMADLTGSFYESPERNGLRVGISMFRCKKEVDSKGPKILLNATGDRTEIDKGFTALFDQQANKPLTCAYGALLAANRWIANQTAITPPQRKTAIIYLTDGMIEGGDYQNIQNEGILDSIQDSNSTQVFGVSVGKREAQIDQISQITGDRGLVFDASDETGLESIIESLTSYMFGDFSTRLANNRLPQEVCLGERPILQVTGSSSGVILDLQCEFTMETFGNKLFNKTVAGVRSQSTGFWECVFPESLFSGDGKGQQVLVELFSIEGETKRRLGLTQQYQLGRPACMNLVPSGDDSRCLGDRTSFDISGPSINYYFDSEVSTSDIFCHFELEDGNVKISAGTFEIGPTVQCFLPEENKEYLFGGDPVDELAAQDGNVTVLGLRAYSSFKITVTPRNGGDTIIFPSVDIPALDTSLDDSTCVDKVVPESACWRRPDQATLAFYGKTVRSFLAREVSGNVELVCHIETDVHNEAFFIPAVATPGDNSRVECPLPEQVVEPRADGSSAWILNVDLYIWDKSSRQAVRASNFFNQTHLFAMSPCITLQQANTEYCFGDQVAVNIQSIGDVPLTPAQDEQVECNFLDSRSDISFLGELRTATSGTGYVCESNEQVGNLLSYTFDAVQLRSKGNPLIVQELVSSGRACFSVLSRNNVQEPFVDVDAKFPALQKCWGDSTSPSALLFKGKSADRVVGQNVTCHFFGGSPQTALGASADEALVVSASYDTESNGLSCAVPSETYLGLGGSAMLEVELYIYIEGQQRTLLTSNVTVLVDTNAPCFETIVSPVGQDDSAPLCVGTETELRVSGSSSSLLTSRLSQVGSFDCVFNTGDVTQGSADGNSVTCSMPEKSALESFKVSSVTMGGHVNLKVSEYGVTEAHKCFRPQVVISEQTGRRRALQGTTTKTYCLGDGFATSVEGDTIEFILGEYGAENISCVWNVDMSAPFVDPSVTTHVTTAIQLSGNSISCESLPWDPFTKADLNNGVYESLDISLVPTSDRIGSKVQYNSFGALPQVCSEVADWGNQVSPEEQDCKRDSVEIGLGGRTAIRLSNPPENRTFECWGDAQYEADAVMCEFVSVDSSTLLGRPSIDGTRISCVAPGWRPDKPEQGNYKEIRMKVCLDDQTTRTVKSTTFAPTADRSCITFERPAEACIGDPVDLSFIGATLSAYVAYAAENGLSFAEQIGCARGNTNLANRATGTSSVLCRIVDSFLPASPDNLNLAVDVSVTYQSLGNLIDPQQVNIPMMNRNSETCVKPLTAITRCSGSDMGTEVGVTGAVASNLGDENNALQLEDISCVFTNETSRRQSQVPVRLVSVDNDFEVRCESGESFTDFKIMYLTTGELFEGVVQKDNSTCTQRATATDPPTPAGSAPTSSPSDDSSNLGMILGIVFAGIVAALLVVFFVVRKRNRDNESQNDTAPQVVIDGKAKGDSGPAEPLLDYYVVGDRVEADLTPHAPPGEDNVSSSSSSLFKGWFKGTIIGDNGDGNYNVELDHLRGVEEDPVLVVAGNCLRKPLSDYRVGDVVEARFGGGPAWHSATVEGVGPNNTYNLTYDEEGLSEESGVDGELIRNPVMVFNVGNVVEARTTENGRFIRGSITSVDPTAESYSIAFMASDVNADATAKDGEEEEVLMEVRAENVRAFVPKVGEVFNVHLDTEVVRGKVERVNLEQQTCDIAYDEEAPLPATPRPQNVSWALLHRPVFHVGQLVQAKLASEPLQAGTPSSNNASISGKRIWLPGKIVHVSQGKDTYGVEFDDQAVGREDNVPVERLRAVDAAMANGPFAVGDLVKVEVEMDSESANTGVQSKKWHKAKVEAANADGTYDIGFESGPKAGKMELNVPVHRIKELDEDFVDESDVQLQGTTSPIPDVFRPPPRDHPQASEDDGLQVPYHLRFRKRKPLDYVELPNNRFEVTLDMSEGLGLSLGWTNDNRVIVAGFRDLPNGDWGPVEACGLVGLKDQLLEVNANSINGKSFVEVSELIKNSGKTIKLQFGRWSDEDAINIGAPPNAAA